MDSATPRIPPGFRFHPTDEELVGYYLKKKVTSRKIDLNVIGEVDLYRIEPWDLQERCRIGFEEQSEWYFFSHKDKKYPTGTRTNRATMAGFWKATGRDKSILEKNKLIGMRKTLVFYIGRAPNGQKTDWIMHEYRLESEENATPQEEGWVVCRAFKKRTASQPRSTFDPWESTYCFDNPSKVASIIDLIEFPPNYQRSSICKQESEIDHLKQLPCSTQFVQLPQLESPSLQLVKNPSLVSMAPENEDDEDQVRGCNGVERSATDWRAFDKFVASQLSHEEEFGHGQVAGFGIDNDREMALMLLRNEREEGSRSSGFMSTGSECGIGFCIY